MERGREGGDRRGELRERRLGLRCRAPHGLTPQQLFTWRRQALGALDTPAPSLFVQAVVEPELPASVLATPRRRLGSRTVDSGLIEVEIDGIVVRVGRGAEAKTVAAVLRALRVPS